MAYDSENKILSTDGSGITLWEIAQCLGDYRVNTAGRRDLGMLCTSPKINKWSKRKPSGAMGNSAFDVPTDDELSIDNYAIDVPQLYCSMLWNVTSTATEEERIFGYNRPLTWFRMLDFDGYNHKALLPFTLTLSNVTINAFHNVKVSVTITKNTDAEITLDMLRATDLTGDGVAALNEWNLAVFCGGLTITVPTYLFKMPLTMDWVLMNSPYTLDLEFPNGDYMVEGVGVRLMCCLVHSSVIAANEYIKAYSNLASESSGNLPNDYYFVPLNFTDKMEGEITVTSLVHSYPAYMFNAASLTYASKKYSVGATSMYISGLAGSPPDTSRFYITFVLMRDGEVVETVASYAPLATWSYNSTLRRWGTSLLDAMTLTLSTTPQSGDTLVVQKKFLNDDGVYEPCGEETLYTH